MSQMNTTGTGIERSPTMRRLSLTTALTGLALAGYGRGAYAGACSGVGGTYLCSGPADPATDTAIAITRSGPVTVTTEDGFGVDTSDDPDAIALEILSEDGADISTGSDVSITAHDTPATPTTAGAVYIRNESGGTVTVDTSGATLRGQNGLSVYNIDYGFPNAYGDEADLRVTAGETRATSGTALSAVNRAYAYDGASLVIDTTAGEVSSGTGIGIDAQGAGYSSYGYADLVVTTGDVSGGAGAVRARSEADGYYGADVVIDTTAGTVVSTAGRGIEAMQLGYSYDGTTDLVITTADVTGATDGIAAYSDAYGYEYSDLIIDTTQGTVTGTDGAGIDVTQYAAGGTADLLITTADVTGATDGIAAYSDAYGYYGSAIVIDSTAGSVIGRSDTGIYVRTTGDHVFGTSDLFVTTGDVMGGITGIDARSDATGPGDSVLSIDTTAGSVLGEAGQGIRAVSGAQSSDGVVDLSITTADVTASAIAADLADPRDFDDHASRTRYGGVTALLTGTGETGANMVIDTSAGVVDSTSGVGIVAQNSATSATGAADLSITTGDVEAAIRGIGALHRGIGADGARLIVDTTAGAVTTDAYNGIYARSDARSSGGAVDMTVVTGDVRSISADLDTVRDPTNNTNFFLDDAAAVTAVTYGQGETGASLSIDTTGGVLQSGAGDGVYAGTAATSANGRADLTITTGDVQARQTFARSIVALQYSFGAEGADLEIDTTAGAIDGGLNPDSGGTFLASRGIDARHFGDSSRGTANVRVVTGDIATRSTAIFAGSAAEAHGDASLTIDTTAGEVFTDSRTGFVSNYSFSEYAIRVINEAESATGSADTTVRTGSVTVLRDPQDRGYGIDLVSGAQAEGSVDVLVDTTAGAVVGDIQVDGTDARTSRSGSANITVLTGDFSGRLYIRDTGRAATSADITVDTTAGATSGNNLDGGRERRVSIRTSAQAGETVDIRGTFGDLAGPSTFAGDGLSVTHAGSGDMGANTILDTTTGTVGSAYGYGIDVDHDATAEYGTANLVITTADVTGGAGGMRIVAGADGYYGADVTIDSSAGMVTGRTGEGIRAVQAAYSAEGSASLSITTGAVEGGASGISAYNGSTGSADTDLTIDTTGGAVSGLGSDGISVRNAGRSGGGTAELSVVTADVQGAIYGIYASGSASADGSVDVTLDTSAGAVTGEAGDGLFASQYGTSSAGSARLSIVTGDVRGASRAIYAQSSGYGAGSTDMSIDTTAGDVTGGGDYSAIQVTNRTDTGALRVSSGDVSGGLHGINAETSASGGLVVRAAPDGAGVVGTTGSGIDAINTGTGATRVTVDGTAGAGAVAGGIQGIYASHGSGAAFGIDVTTGRVSNLSGQADDRAISARSTGSGVALTIGTGSAVVGTLSLTDADDIVVNDGLWNPTGGVSDFGGGEDVFRNTSLNTLVVGNGQPGQVTVFDNLTTFVNAGRIDMADGDATGRLRFSGDFQAAPGSVIEMNIAFGPGAFSADTVTIGGDVTGGATAVRLFPVAGGGGLTGFGQNDGVEIITVQGASQAGDFVLEAPVQQDIFVYGNLVRGTDGSWRVQSQYLPSIPAYEVYPSLLLNMTVLPSLLERTGPGALRGDGGSDRRPWLQLGGTMLERGTQGSTAQSSYRQSFTTLDTGIDFALSDTDTASLSLHYSQGSADVSSPHGSAEFDMRGLGIGASYTWQGASGLYLDTQARLTFFKTDVPGASTEHAVGRAASVEVGRSFDTASGWRITPQGRLTYSGIDFDDFTGDTGETVSLSDGVTVQARVGVSFERDWESGSAFYGTVSLAEALNNGTAVDVSVLDTHRFERNDSGTTLEIGLGGRLAIGDNTFISGSAATARHQGSNGNGGENWDTRLQLSLGMTW